MAKVNYFYMSGEIFHRLFCGTKNILHICTMGIESQTMDSKNVLTGIDNSRLFFTAISKGNYDVLKDADMRTLSAPGIYCIFNSHSKMVYVGCSVNVSNRILRHKSALSVGNHICRVMASDYQKSPESFYFFSIQYIDESAFELSESIRNHLFSLETQYIKRVPIVRLYNSIIPASLSEKLLLLEQPKRQKPIPITEIIGRLEMSADSIRSNGFSNSDVLTLKEAIDFVQKRTVSGGRWPEEKAALARAYLAELMNEKQPETEEDLLIRGGVMDYFDARYVEPQIEVSNSMWALWVVMACGLLTSIPNMYAMTLAIKAGDWKTATGVTAAFTLAPAFLLWAGAKEWYARICIAMVIGYEVFCNAASFYGGLTGLNHATFIDPTNFLHMATGFAFNSEYEATARVISVFMSIGIALLVAIPVIKLGKNK